MEQSPPDGHMKKSAMEPVANFTLSTADLAQFAGGSGCLRTFARKWIGRPSRLPQLFSRLRSRSGRPNQSQTPFGSGDNNMPCLQFLG